MNNKKMIIIILLLIIIHAPLNVKAQVIEEKEEHCNTPILKIFGEIDRSKTIEINGIDNPLYCVFKDKEYAMNKLKENVPDLLEYIKNKYNLQTLNSSNWKDYKTSMYELMNDDSKYNEDSKEIIILRSFFGIYEDDEKNEEIIEYVNTNNKKIKNVDSIEYLEISYMLPYYSSMARSVEENTTYKINAKSSFNVSKAINYAKKYAYEANNKDYEVFKQDCTNFASQILEAGGVSQEVYDSVYKGWWHKKTMIAFVPHHTNSHSWSLADVFARYMGVGYTTNNNNDFSKNIKKGDFVALDFDNNGTWDHLGFVTDKKTSPACYWNGDYIDYKIAQHSDNYNAWGSDKNENNWPKKGTQGAKYARIRR